MQEQHLSVGAKAEDDAKLTLLTLHPQLTQIPIAFQRKPLEMGFSQLRLMGLGQLIKLHDDLLPQAWIETINKFRELGRLIRC